MKNYISVFPGVSKIIPQRILVGYLLKAHDGKSLGDGYLLLVSSYLAIPNKISEVHYIYKYFIMQYRIINGNIQTMYTLNNLINYIFIKKQLNLYLRL